jgi:hypothetical protein
VTLGIRSTWPLLGALGFVLFCIVGCGGAKDRLASLSTNAISLSPGQLKTKFIFNFSNWAERDLSPVQGDWSTATKIAQTWSSNCSGEFRLQWEGYQLLEPQPRAEFSYQLDKLRFKETDHWPDFGSQWSEQYGGEPPVQMQEQGVSRSDAMGEMLGNPLESFLGAWSKAYFLPQGEAYREEGQLHPANYLTESAETGQYFLGGFKVEELVHRLITPLPPKWESGIHWEAPRPRWVDAPPPNLPLVEKWTCTKIKEGWLLTAEVSDRLELTSISGLNRPIRSWRWKRSLKALVDPQSYIPIEVEWKDEGSWIDDFSYIQDPKTKSALPLLHRWKNHFKARRS